MVMTTIRLLVSAFVMLVLIDRLVGADLAGPIGPAVAVLIVWASRIPTWVLLAVAVLLVLNVVPGRRS